MASESECSRTTPQAAPSEASPTHPLLALLAQLEDLLSGMTDEQYTRAPVGEIRSSVGSHVRHCLDHVEAWVRAAESGELDYDHRERGTLLERDRAVALETVRRLHQEVRAVPAEALHRALRLSAQLSPGGPSYQAASSVMRELMFVVSHTIHHNALIAVMLRTLGASAPDHFGYAPSTLTHLRKAQAGA